MHRLGVLSAFSVAALLTVLALPALAQTYVLPTAELELSKEAIGEPPSDEPYGFRIDCSEQDPLDVELAAGETIGFPVILDEETGATCLVEETEDLGADDTRFFVEDDDVGVPGPVTVVFDPPFTDDQDEQVVALRVANTFDPPDEPTPTPTPVDEVEVEPAVVEPPEDEVEVLALTGFDLTWGMLLALGLLIPGGAALYLSRRRDRGRA